MSVAISRISFHFISSRVCSSHLCGEVSPVFERLRGGFNMPGEGLVERNPGVRRSEVGKLARVLVSNELGGCFED